jgi:SAM-dependent methyltransferase
VNASAGAPGPAPGATQAGLLHHGGGGGSWASLGLWRGAADYATAARALAEATGRAAGLARGDRVLSLACGAGDELLLWLEAFGAAEVVGVERDAAAAEAARRLLARAGRARAASVLTADAMALDIAALGRFDTVLCVDAAYHLRPRVAFLQAAARLLRPGGRLAYCDLVRPADPGRSPLLRASARLCGLSFDDLLPEPAQRQRLLDDRWVDVRIERLDDAVLGGFARFVAAQRQRLGAAAWQRAWWRPAITAALIPPCLRLGLGYALLSARQPP